MAWSTSGLMERVWKRNDDRATEAQLDESVAKDRLYHSPPRQILALPKTGLEFINSLHLNPG